MRFILFTCGVLAIDLAFGELGLQSIDTQFQELQSIHKSPCTQAALREFIQECTAKGADSVDVDIRISLAVKLSICELEETEVDYPDCCKSLTLIGDFKRCIQEFRKNSQLWTTYSGNYRKLRTICFEEAFPFMKDHVVDLFYNITKVYSGFFNETVKASQTAELFRGTIEKRFEDLIDLMTQLLHSRQHQEEEMQQDFEIFEASMVTAYSKAKSDIVDISAGIYNNINGISNELRHVNALVTDTISRFNDMNNEFNEQGNIFGERHKEITSNAVNDILKMKNFLEEGMKTSVLMKDSLENNYHMSNQVNAGLQTFDFNMKEWLTNIDITAVAAFDDFSNHVVSKADDFAKAVDTRLQTVIERTDTLHHQLQSRLKNVTNTVIDMENQLSRITIPLFFSGVSVAFQGYVTNTILAFRLMGLMALILLLFVSILKRNIHKLINVLYSMTPGIATALLLRILISHYWV